MIVFRYCIKWFGSVWRGSRLSYTAGQEVIRVTRLWSEHHDTHCPSQAPGSGKGYWWDSVDLALCRADFFKVLFIPDAKRTYSKVNSTLPFAQSTRTCIGSRTGHQPFEGTKSCQCTRDHFKEFPVFGYALLPHLVFIVECQNHSVESVCQAWQNTHSLEFIELLCG